MNRKRSPYWLCLTAPLFFSLVACDGTGGIDGSGDAVVGIDGSGGPTAVSAPIDGFGSIIINDTTYNTDEAQFFFRGDIGTQSDLSEGQLATIITDLGSDTPRASQVFYFPDVTGEVTFVDPISQRIIILNRSVLITNETRFDDNFSGEKSFAGIQIGMMLTVSGTARDDGVVVATYINETQQTTVDISGFISELNTEALTFMIGDQAVSYDGITGDSVNNLTNGNAVWLEGVVDETGVLQASEIFGRDDREASLAAENIELEGRISNWNQSERRFSLGTFSVTYPEPLDISQLVQGSQVIVRGKIENDIIEADSIELVVPSLFHDSGVIESLGPLVIDGQTVGTFLRFKNEVGQQRVNEDTTIVKDRQGNILTLDDLQVGDVVSSSRPTFTQPTCVPGDQSPQLGWRNFIAQGFAGGLDVDTIILEFRASEGIEGRPVEPSLSLDGFAENGELIISPGQSTVALAENAILENRLGRTLSPSEISNGVSYVTKAFGRLADDGSGDFESLSLVRFIVSTLDCEGGFGDPVDDPLIQIFNF